MEPLYWNVEAMGDRDAQVNLSSRNDTGQGSVSQRKPWLIHTCVE